MEFKRGKPIGPLKKVGAGARHRHDRLLPARPDDLPADRVRPGDDPRAARGRELPPQGREGHASTTRRTARDESLPAREGHRRLPEEDHRRARREAGPRGAVRAREATRAAARSSSSLQWTESTDEHVRSYVNGIPTGSGGTHENGLRAGLGKAVRNYIETHNLSPQGVTITAEDIREGLIGVLSVYIAEPQFQGQTKDRLNNPEVQVDGRLGGAPGARAVAQHEPQRRRSDRRAHHPRGARPRGLPRRVGGGLAQDGDERPAQPARQAERLHRIRPRGDRAVHRRGRLRRRLREAGPRSRAARRSCRCAARC